MTNAEYILELIEKGDLIELASIINNSRSELLGAGCRNCAFNDTNDWLRSFESNTSVRYKCKNECFEGTLKWLKSEKI